jgi:hypothetical protein
MLRLVSEEVQPYCLLDPDRNFYTGFTLPAPRFDAYAHRFAFPSLQIMHNVIKTVALSYIHLRNKSTTKDTQCHTGPHRAERGMSWYNVKPMTDKSYSSLMADQSFSTHTMFLFEIVCQSALRREFEIA